MNSTIAVAIGTGRGPTDIMTTIKTLGPVVNDIGAKHGRKYCELGVLYKST